MGKTIKRLIFDSLFLFLAVLTIIFFWKNTILTSIFLVIISICILAKAAKIDILFFVIIGLSATFIESLTISSGAWIYSTQHISIVPLWIPLYWGIGGIIIKDIYLFLKKY